MASLTSLLPKPKNTFRKSTYKKSNFVQNTSVAVTVKGPPPYRKRLGFAPRTPADFGDGGAFPEIHVSQFPLNMGLKETEKNSTLPLKVDANGKLDYSALVKYGQDKDRKVQTSFRDAMPTDLTARDQFEKPSQEEIDEVTEKTKMALQKIIDEKVANSQPKHVIAKKETEAPKFYKYTPTEQFNNPNAPKERVVRIVQLQADPLEPPMAKYRRMPRPPPSPPAPVLHSPTRKVTVQEQNAWKIPPCVSNWKNPRGYTIPLDKRLAADGRGLQEVVINDNFAKLSESLYIADRQARDEIEQRAALERKLAESQKREKEEKLRLLAQQAREERSGIGRREEEESDDERRHDSSYKEREEIRRIRQKERERELKSKRRGKDSDRDVSEKVALGVAKPTYSVEQSFDSRLFNQSEGLNSGFKDEEAYDLYDKPLFKGSSANLIYRPKKSNVDDEIAGTSAAVDALLDTARFKPQKGFAGTEEAKPYEGPVQFEKDEEQDDPFGLNEFLTEAKKGKRALDSIGSKGLMTVGGYAGSKEEISASSGRKIEFQSAKKTRQQ
ncbi:hypothetical protein ROZALSC1DRAFT_27920 [Rozella allomycis CSF55]|uniref:Pre-mRNA-processing protein 45 n=1 Tax=Rozella allomycis (strain CSF55) TaxID=988480 RepID=A0A4P9YPJ9_ROZAC|nr:hypothetical protein ROZALSC1DRAFT_27920 [Rozella allomycis CSF55]